MKKVLDNGQQNMLRLHNEHTKGFIMHHNEDIQFPPIEGNNTSIGGPIITISILIVLVVSTFFVLT